MDDPFQLNAEDVTPEMLRDIILKPSELGDDILRIVINKAEADPAFKAQLLTEIRAYKADA